MELPKIIMAVVLLQALALTAGVGLVWFAIQMGFEAPKIGDPFGFWAKSRTQSVANSVKRRDKLAIAIKNVR